MRVVAFVVAAGLAAACMRSSPTGMERTCRRYATSFTANGSPYECRLEGARYTCRAFHTDRTWVYRSVADFVLEAQVPNRLQVRSEEGTWVATWAYIGSGGSTTAYGYDGAGRLTRRKRTSYYSLGGQNETAELDAVEYRSWDARGRPTAGILSAGGESEPLVLMYDDAARHVEASNGESVTRDADGNMAPCHQVPSP